MKLDENAQVPLGVYDVARSWLQRKLQEYARELNKRFAPLSNAGGDLHLSGQVRAGGWNSGSTVGALNGAAAELGFSVGEAYLIGYDRGGATYKKVNVQGSDVALLVQSGDVFVDVKKTTPPTIGTNGLMVFNLTSNTNLRISVRGSDGTTRVANITLA